MEFGDAEVPNAPIVLTIDLDDGAQVIRKICVAYHRKVETTERSGFLDEEKQCYPPWQKNVTHWSHEADGSSQLHGWDSYRELYESMQEMLFEISFEGRILFVSATSKSILGYAPSELIGKRLFQFIRPEEILKFHSSLEAINLDKASVLESRFRTADGHYKWCRISAFTVMRQGKKVEARGFLFDIAEMRTTQQTAEENRARLNQLFEHMNE